MPGGAWGSAAPAPGGSAAARAAGEPQKGMRQHTHTRNGAEAEELCDKMPGKDNARKKSAQRFSFSL